jgi:hypothetical protein
MATSQVSLRGEGEAAAVHVAFRFLAKHRRTAVAERLYEEWGS